VDCSATGANASGSDFGGGSTQTNCASSDATATGTNCITSINPAVEFVDAANDDFRLAGGSQLIGAGSTGNNIGWFQSPSITNIDDDNLIDIGQATITVTVANSNPAWTNIGLNIGGSVVDNAIVGGENATYVSSAGDVHTFNNTAGINALPADTPTSTLFSYTEA
jgi:hypothetical protein